MTLLNPFLFLTTMLIWGTTFIALVLQVGSVPVIISIFYRFVIATIILCVILALTGRLKCLPWRDQPFLIAQGACLFCLNFICFYSSAHYIPSGLIAVIFSLTTIFNAINARVFFQTPISKRIILAGSMGLTGLVLLFWRDVFASFSITQINLDILKGAGFAVLGTYISSLGNMASRRNSQHGIAVNLANGWGMCYSAVLLCVLIVATQTPLVAPPNAQYIWALLYLAVFGSVFAFGTYLLLVARIGAASAAYVNVISPIIALGISTVVEGYQWGVLGVLGCGLALLGSAVMFVPMGRKMRL